jgi:hypothetical protein
MRSFFHNHVDDAIELIHGQIMQVEERGARVRVRHILCRLEPVDNKI